MAQVVIIQLNKQSHENCLFMANSNCLLRPGHSSGDVSFMNVDSGETRRTGNAVVYSKQRQRRRKTNCDHM